MQEKKSVNETISIIFSKCAAMLEWTKASMLQKHLSFQNEIQNYWMLTMLE